MSANKLQREFQTCLEFLYSRRLLLKQNKLKRKRCGIFLFERLGELWVRV